MNANRKHFESVSWYALLALFQRDSEMRSLNLSKPSPCLFFPNHQHGMYVRVYFKRCGCLIPTKNVLLQRNACAALISIVQLGETPWKAAVNAGAVNCLLSSSYAFITALSMHWATTALYCQLHSLYLSTYHMTGVTNKAQALLTRLCKGRDAGVAELEWILCHFLN